MTQNPIKPETFFTDLINHAGQFGYQMSNRYLVFIDGPGRSAFDRINPSEYGPKNPTELSSQDAIIGSLISPEWKKRLALNCTSASLPGKSVETQLFSVYGPTSKLPYVENYTNEITLTFNCSSDMFERKYFTAWQGMVVSSDSNSIKYYSDYAKKFSITIMVLPSSIASFQQLRNTKPSSASSVITAEPYDMNALDDFAQSIYFIQLQECYPIELLEQQISYEGSNQILKFSVKMAFANWFDPVTQYERQMRDMLRSYSTDTNGKAQEYTDVLLDDPDSRIEADGYANRGRVLAAQKLELTEDRVGLQKPKDLSPFQKLISYAREVVRYSNPKEFRQLVADKGIAYLGDAFGIENVEAAAQGGQVVDVYRQSGAKGISGLRDKLLTPLSDIETPSLPNGPSFVNSL